MSEGACVFPALFASRARGRGLRPAPSRLAAGQAEGGLQSGPQPAPRSALGGRSLLACRRRSASQAKQPAGFVGESNDDNDNAVACVPGERSAAGERRARAKTEGRQQAGGRAALCLPQRDRLGPGGRLPPPAAGFQFQQGRPSFLCMTRLGFPGRAAATAGFFLLLPPPCYLRFRLCFCCKSRPATRRFRNGFLCALAGGGLRFP